MARILRVRSNLSATVVLGQRQSKNTSLVIDSAHLHQHVSQMSYASMNIHKQPVLKPSAECELWLEEIYFDFHPVDLEEVCGLW